MNGLGYERIDVAGGRERSTLVCDPRYFAIMGLVLGHLNMEIVTHESVHAAFAYAGRHHKNLWLTVGDLEESDLLPRRHHRQADQCVAARRGSVRTKGRP